MLGWDIGVLLLRLSELSQTSPCPPYAVNGQDTALDLLVVQPPPTVGACVRAIQTLDMFFKRWGAKTLAFTFGSGSPDSSYQGKFAIRLRPPTPPPPSITTS